MTLPLVTHQLKTSPGLDHKIAFSNTGKYVAIRPIDSLEKTIVATTADCVILASLPAEVQTVDFLATDDLVVASERGVSKVWRLPGCELVTSISWGKDETPVCVRQIHGTPFLLLLASAPTAETRGASVLSLWDINHWTEVARHVSQVGETCLSIFFQSSHLVKVALQHPRPIARSRGRSYSRILDVTNLDTGKSVPLTEIAWPCESLHLSQDGRWAVLCKEGARREYEVWNLAETKQVATLHFSFDSSPRYDFSPDFDYLVQSYVGRTGVWIWRLSSGELIRQIDDVVHHRPCCSTSHPVFAVMSDVHDNRGAFFYGVSGELLGTALGHAIPMTGGHVFSPCGRWFASAVNSVLNPESHPHLPSGTVLLTDLQPILPPKAS